MVHLKSLKTEEEEEEEEDEGRVIKARNLFTSTSTKLTWLDSSSSSSSSFPILSDWLCWLSKVLYTPESTQLDSTMWTHFKNFLFSQQTPVDVTCVSPSSSLVSLFSIIWRLWRPFGKSEKGRTVAGHTRTDSTFSRLMWFNGSARLLSFFLSPPFFTCTAINKLKQTQIKHFLYCSERRTV